MKTICFIVLSLFVIHTSAQDNNNTIDTPNGKNTLSYEPKKNIVSFNYGDLGPGRVSLSYERLIKEGKLGIKVPLSFSIEQYPYGPKYYGGLGLNYYPMGQKKLTYYTGITAHMGVFNRNYYEYYPMDNYPYYYEMTRKDHIYGGAYITNGLVWNIIQNFSISGQFGLGIIDLEGDQWGSRHATGELNASIRF